MIASIVFRCPNTGIDVQHSVEDQPDGTSDSFAPVQCPACARIHFLDRKTMKPSGRGRGGLFERTDTQGRWM